MEEGDKVMVKGTSSTGVIVKLFGERDRQKYGTNSRILIATFKFDGSIKEENFVINEIRKII